MYEVVIFMAGEFNTDSPAAVCTTNHSRSGINIAHPAGQQEQYAILIMSRRGLLCGQRDHSVMLVCAFV
jgi:hypothetical protein